MKRHDETIDIMSLNDFYKSVKTMLLNKTMNKFRTK